MSPKKKIASLTPPRKQSVPPRKAAETASGRTDEDFNNLARRMERMEAELKELKQAATPPAPPKAKKLRPTKRDIAQAQAREYEQNELVYNYMVATNVMADLDRLLRDQNYGGVGAPRPGMSPAHEELRLATANSLIGGFQQENIKAWANFQPEPGQPFTQLPPAQAREFVVKHLRRQVNENMPKKASQVADMMADDAFGDTRPSLNFDRVNGAPTAADEGAALGQQIIQNIFDQLESNMPGYGDGAKVAQSTRALPLIQSTLEKTVAKYRPPQQETFATHEELFANCYMAMTLNAVAEAVNLMSFGSMKYGTDAPPETCRLAGSILTQMGIAQRPNPDQLSDDELNEKGIDNGFPAERTSAAQIREMVRVIDVLQDSLYDGELQEGVRALYAQEAAKFFPGEPLREVEGKFETAGWNATRKVLEKSNLALFRLAQKEDSWAKPNMSPPDRDTWVFAAPTLQ